MTNQSEPVKIAIIGAGNVGATTAYSLLLKELAAEIVLVDIDRSKAEGEALDLNDVIPFSHWTRVRAGSYADCADAAVTILAAGSDLEGGEPGLNLAQRNASILYGAIPEVVRYAPRTILLIATTPIDVMTYLSGKLSGFDAKRVIGLGTMGDTARLRFLLGRHFGIDPLSVHAYIIGQHGDAEVPVWSLANIAGISLQDFCEHQGEKYAQAEMETLFRQASSAGHEIVRRKGAMCYTVAAGLVRIIEAIFGDENTLLTVSSLAAHYGISEVCLSLPTKINRNGADRILQLPLNQEELSGLVKAAESVKTAIRGLGLDAKLAEDGVATA